MIPRTTRARTPATSRISVVLSMFCSFSRIAGHSSCKRPGNQTHLRKPSWRISVITAGPKMTTIPARHFQVHELELLAELRVRDLHVLRDFHKRLIQAEPCFDANDQQVQSIGQSLTKPALPRTDPPGQPHVGEQ